MAPNAQLVSTLSIFRASWKKKKKAEKLKHNSLGESEACKVDTVLKVMTNSYHHRGKSVAAPTIADYALQQECKSRTELLAGWLLPWHPPAHSPQKSTLSFTLKPWLFGKPSSCSRKVMYVRSMQRKGLFPGLISMVLQTKKKENSVWVHTVGSGLKTTQLWKISNESKTTSYQLSCAVMEPVTMGLKWHTHIRISTWAL